MLNLQRSQWSSLLLFIFILVIQAVRQFLISPLKQIPRSFVGMNMCDYNHHGSFPRSRRPCINTPQTSGCCTPRSNSNATTTQTDTCHHHHTQSREITRTNSAPAIVSHECGGNNCTWASTQHHQCFRGTTRIEVLLRELLDHCVEDNYSSCSEICTSSHSWSECQRHDRCTICECDRQIVVSELMELLERFSIGSGSSCDVGMIRWDDRCGGSRNSCGGHSFGREIRYESLFELIFRLTKRKSHVSRHGRCSGGDRRRHDDHACTRRWEQTDWSLKTLVGQLLDELEGSAGCDCQSCCEYLEFNLRKVRRDLRRSSQCGGRRVMRASSQGCCDEGSGCSSQSCCENVVSETVVYGQPTRRPRAGNVHVGWSIR